MRRVAAAASRGVAAGRVVQRRGAQITSYQGSQELWEAQTTKEKYKGTGFQESPLGAISWEKHEKDMSKQFKPKRAKALMFINYRPVEIEPGEEALIEVCLREGIIIPKFCYHPRLSVAGNCRMCMVQMAGTQLIVVACATPVSPGMSVLTETRLVVGAREGNVEMLMINHPIDCPICPQQWECDLQDITNQYGSNRSRFREDKHASMDKTIDPGIRSSFVKCIHCTRCTRWVQECTKEWTWGMMGRGGASEISTFIPKKYSKANMWHNVNHFAGHMCPVGALFSTFHTYANVAVMYQKIATGTKHLPSLRSVRQAPGDKFKTMSRGV